MKMVRLLNSIMFILVIACFSGCAYFDDYLEASSSKELSSKEPSVVFKADLYKTRDDMIVLMGIGDASIPFALMRSKEIEFYLRNTNKDISVVDGGSQKKSELLRFSYVGRHKLGKIKEDFPRLAGQYVYAVYLRALKADLGRIGLYRTMGDGDLRNISDTALGLIRARKVVLVAKSLDKERSGFYEELVGKVFHPGTP
jgi:hypothetical protein